MVIVIPALVAGAALVGGLYEVGKAYENRRYWDSYRRNTGRSPRWYFRSGYSNLGSYSRIIGYSAAMPWSYGGYRGSSYAGPEYGYW